MSVDVWEKIAVTVIGAAIVSLLIWLVRRMRERSDKKTVYNFLYERTKEHRYLTVGSPINDLRWVSTIEIAEGTNLSPDRVQHICSIHKKIRPMTEEDLWPRQSLEEKWCIREFVDRALQFRKREN